MIKTIRTLPRSKVFYLNRITNEVLGIDILECAFNDICNGISFDHYLNCECDFNENLYDNWYYPTRNPAPPRRTTVAFKGTGVGIPAINVLKGIFGDNGSEYGFEYETCNDIFDFVNFFSLVHVNFCWQTTRRCSCFGNIFNRWTSCSFFSFSFYTRCIITYPNIIYVLLQEKDDMILVQQHQIQQISIIIVLKFCRKEKERFE